MSRALVFLGVFLGIAPGVSAWQSPDPAQPPQPQPPPSTAAPAPVPVQPAASVGPAPASVATPVPALAVPADYVIGPDDILSVLFWRDKEMSADVVVRPDGRITLPLLNDVVAGGATPEQLKDRISEQAARFVEDPSVTVVVKQINSRKVFVTGNVGRQGAYPLSGPSTVLQMLSLAGGVAEFADAKKILIMRTENGQQKVLKFNLRDVMKGKNLQQNVLLKPGDTIVVP